MKKKTGTLEDFGLRAKTTRRKSKGKKVRIEQPWRGAQYALEKKVKEAFKEFKPKYNVKISGRKTGKIKPTYPEMWFGLAMLKDMLRGMYPGKKKKEVKKREDLAPKKGYVEVKAVDRTLEGGKVEKTIEKERLLKQASLRGDIYKQAPEEVKEKILGVRGTVDVDVAAKVGDRILVGEIKKIPDRNSPALVGKYVRETALLHMLLLTDPLLVRKVVGKNVTKKDKLVPMIIFNRKLTPEEQKAAEFELWRARNAFGSIVTPFEATFLHRSSVEVFSPESRKALVSEQEKRMKAEATASTLKPLILSVDELPAFAEKVRKGSKLSQELPLFPAGPAAVSLEQGKLEEKMIRMMDEDKTIRRIIHAEGRGRAKHKKKTD